MEGPKAPSPERGTEARSAGVPRGWGLGRGAVAPPQYGGLGALPQKILKFNSANLLIFFHNFKTEIALPSVVFHSFTASKNLFIIDHPVVSRKVNTVKTEQ